MPSCARISPVTTKENATSRREYEYDAYGDLTSSPQPTINPFLFDGQAMDGQTGLIYLRARYMSPGDGRFLSQDPFEGDGEDPVSLHRYLYVADDPVDLADPGGEKYGFEEGNEVHKKIEANFLKVRPDPEGAVERTLYQAYEDAYKIRARGYLPAPWNRPRIDMLDYAPSSVSPDFAPGQKAFYEIEPLSQFDEGLAQVVSYSYGLNYYDPTLGGSFPSPPVWVPGEASAYVPPFLIPLSTGQTAIVLPPIYGLIVYTTIDPHSITAPILIGDFKLLGEGMLGLVAAGASSSVATIGTAAGESYLVSPAIVSALSETETAAQSIAAVNQIPSLITVGATADEDQL